MWVKTTYSCYVRVIYLKVCVRVTGDGALSKHLHILLDRFHECIEFTVEYFPITSSTHSSSAYGKDADTPLGPREINQTKTDEK